ncbi:hypothetical protein FBR00_15375 [Anaerolineae bacterium CFX4]|nr:hypothetical protein [Anaerolineae bacterium CFX4]
MRYSGVIPALIDRSPRQAHWPGIVQVRADQRVVLHLFSDVGVLSDDARHGEQRRETVAVERTQHDRNLPYEIQRGETAPIRMNG